MSSSSSLSSLSSIIRIISKALELIKSANGRGSFKDVMATLSVLSSRGTQEEKANCEWERVSRAMRTYTVKSAQARLVYSVR